jgi:hypothetical protein
MSSVAEAATGQVVLMSSSWISLLSRTYFGVR